jgi:autotransporter translocation and assembly factor TamB
MRDPDFAEARGTIRALQLALDVAHDRIRDGERIIGELNLRLTVQTERVDAAEFRLLVLQASAPARVDATLHGVDIPAQLPFGWK